MAEHDSQTASYVWVRLVKNDAEAKVAVGKVELVPGSLKFVIQGGPRPPSTGTAVQSVQGGDSGAAFLMDTWHSGLESASTSFDLGPAFDDAGAARDWIVGAAGLAWANASMNYFLLVHSPVTIGERHVHSADLTPTPHPPTDRFPPDDWDPVLIKSITRHPPARDTVLGTPIKLGPASSFGSTDTAVLQQLRADARSRLTFRADIDFEAQGLDQVTYRMLAVVGLSTDHPVNPMLKRLRDAVLDAVLPVLWHYKLRNPQEPRPHQLDPSINPDFKRPHWRNPGHPSFPGGHATVGYTWANLLAAVFAGDRQALFNMARDIAHRREIAGLHFPRDNEAGKELGRLVAEAILQAVSTRPTEPEVVPFAQGYAELQRLSASKPS